MSSFILWSLCLYFVVLCYCDRGEDILDRFNDAEDASTWIVSGGDVHDDFVSQWADDAKWDVIAENVKTQKNHRLTRKCQNMFSRTLCFCEYEKLAVLHSCRKDAASSASALAWQRGSRVAGVPAAATANARGALSNPFRGAWKKQKTSQRVAQAEQVIERDEEQLEYRIAAAQVLAEFDELDEDDVDELQEEAEDLMEEEAELELEQEMSAEKEKVLSAAEQAVDMYEAEYEAEADAEEEDEFMAALEDELEDEILDEALADVDVEDEEDMHGEIIAALDGEVETQNELIEDQDREIKKLKLENAMKEEMISVLEEHEDDALYDNDEEEEEDMIEFEDDEEFEDEFVDDDEGEYEFFDVQSAQDQLVDESYNELYDVNGDEENIDNENDWFDAVDVESEYDGDDEGADEEEVAIDLQRKEADAMLADTFWGIEVYAAAFVLLLCCCCGCYLYKTRCCGFLHPVKRAQFGYAAYAQRSGFKQVFGAVDEEDDDEEDYRNGNAPKIGSNHDESDEESQSMLQ